MLSGVFCWKCLGCGSSFSNPGMVPDDRPGRPGLLTSSGWSPWWAVLLAVALFLGVAVLLAAVVPPGYPASRTGPDFGRDPSYNGVSQLGPAPGHGQVSRSVWAAGEDERMLALMLVNEARASAGAPPVVLGDNPAAQAHAESMAEHCFLSHWGMDGLKPYMRYALAGGFQVNGENASGPLLCPGWLPSKYAGGSSGSEAALRKAVSDTVSGFLESPGHRKTMLDPSYLKLNLGIALTGSTFTMVQQFEGDYVDFTVGPFVEDGVLEMAGEVRNGFGFKRDVDLVVFLFYDPPVRPLDRGQLSRSYCYGGGEVVASLAPGAPFGLWGGGRLWTYRGGGEGGRCPDPYLLEPGLPPPSTLSEARGLFDEARERSSLRSGDEVVIPVDGALEWTALGREFRVRADFGPYLEERGPGVYTVSLWGLAAGEMRPFAERSLFYHGPNVGPDVGSNVGPDVRP